MAACANRMRLLAPARSPNVSLQRFPDNTFATGLDANERRAAALRAEQERAEERHAKIEAQASPFTTPQERIRLWEDLHGLRLPRNPDHKLVRVIASNTALTVQEIHEEQARRSGAAVETRS
jgi:hypothetical protein